MDLLYDHIVFASLGRLLILATRARVTQIFKGLAMLLGVEIFLLLASLRGTYEIAHLLELDRRIQITAQPTT